MVAVAKPLVMHTTSVMKRTVLETYHNGTMSYQDAAASELLLPALCDFGCLRLNGLRKRSSRRVTEQLWV